VTAAAPSLGQRLARSLRLVERLQHPSGEILSYHRDAQGNYVYCRSPLLSTFVHEALDCFDPTSAHWSDGALEILPADARAWFARTVVAVRRRVRAFLLWQQEPAGWWRLFGRGSGMDPDVNTTACAALALAESYGSRSPDRWQRQIDMVLSFRSGSGLFYTFQKPGRGGYGWLDDSGRAVVGFDRVVNVAVLGCLAALGQRDTAAARRLVDRLLDEMAAADLGRGTVLYPNPLAFLYASSRVWARFELPGRSRLAEAVLPALLHAQGPAGDFGGPLSTAMGATALLELDYTGQRRDRARQAVLRGLRPQGGWRYEDVAVGGYGSPAWTTALSMAFLARDHALTGAVVG
jgi:hypothetical protein